MTKAKGATVNGKRVTVWPSAQYMNEWHVSIVGTNVVRHESIKATSATDALRKAKGLVR